MKYSKINRRMFLQGVGGTLLPIPFLSSLFPTNAMANGEPVKRFISILSGYDYGHTVNWYPNPSGQMNNIEQPALMGNGFKYQRLRDFAPTNSVGLSPILGPWLTPYLGSINLMRSLDNIDARGHHMPKLLGSVIVKENNTFLQKIPTIDYVLNNHSRFNPNRLPLALMGFSDLFGGVSYSEDSSNVVRKTTRIGTRARDVYNFIFNNGNAPESGGTQVDPRLDQLTNVIEDYRRIKNHRRISSVDKNRLEQVMDIFSDIKRAGSQGATAQCRHTNLETENASGWRDSAYHTERGGKVFANIITAALLCDLTRTITIGATDPRGDVNGYNWSGHGVLAGGTYGTHGTYSELNGKFNWQVTGMAKTLLSKNFLGPLLSNMSSVTEASNGKSLLHNSLVLYAMESSLTHSGASNPCLLAGNAGGAITSGHYIDYAGDRSRGVHLKSGSLDPNDPQFFSNYHGAHYNRLMVNILQSMGLSPNEYERNLPQPVYGRTDIGAQNAGASNIGGYGYSMISKATRWEKELQKQYNLSDFRKPLPMPATNAS